MKLALFFVLLLTSFLGLSRTKSLIELDSVDYYLKLAKLNTATNNYKNALGNTQKAIDYAAVFKNNTDEAIAFTTLGNIFFDLKKYDDAIDNFKKSIFLYKNLKPSLERALSFYNLGLCYIEKREYSTAEVYLNKAKTIYLAIKTPKNIALLNLQKAIVYKEKGQYNLAYSIFSTLISKPNSKNFNKIKAEALYQIATIESHKGKNKESLNYLFQALKLNTESDDVELKSKIYKELSVVYEKVSDIPNSLFYLKKHLELKENITILNKKKLDDQDYSKFKDGNRLKTIYQMDKENKQQEKTNKFAKLISILAIALISILSLLSLSLYKNNIIRNQSNLLLKEKNKELQLAKDNAEMSAKSRAEFLSTVSHELRTPLHAINGITHLLLAENPKKSQLNYLNSLQFSGNYLLTFINEILEINRIESSTVEAEKINFNLKVLLHNIQKSLKELANNNNNKYILEIDEAIPDNLIGDPIKLSQIFMNLINNALKFTKNGEVKVITKLNVLNKDSACVYFEVLDNGIGIPEDKLETVFDSFSQGSIEINRKYGGTGLGLSIVKKLIDILGGQIKLESKVDHGSRFSFDLNFKLGIEMPALINKLYDESVLVNKRILLVEDNKINQMITKKMLLNKKVICEIIDNGEDAIELVKKNTYDLILMDIHLPGINGTIATEIIRTFNKNTPIVALTAISLNENREMLLSYGMNDVITKPFDPNNFYKVIAQYL